MRQFFEGIRNPLVWERKAILFFAVTLLMTITGPFGTYEDLTFWARLVFWLIIMAGVGFFMHVAVMIALSAKWLRPIGYVPRIALAAAAAGLPGAAFVIFVNMVFRPPTIDPASLPMIWFQVTLIGLPICLVEYPRPQKQMETTAPIRLVARLPDDLGDDIVSLSMQDHYVEVTTTRGKTLILMRMADAVDELDTIPGQRVHRSHWVAQAHLAGTAKSGHRRFVLLKDGRKLPLSDTYAGAFGVT